MHLRNLGEHHSTPHVCRRANVVHRGLQLLKGRMPDPPLALKRIVPSKSPRHRLSTCNRVAAHASDRRAQLPTTLTASHGWQTESSAQRPSETRRLHCPSFCEPTRSSFCEPEQTALSPSIAVRSPSSAPPTCRRPLGRFVRIQPAPLAHPLCSSLSTMTSCCGTQLQMQSDRLTA